MGEIDGRIAQANGRLNAANVGAKIERLGNRLVIRATFPPKPNSSKSHAHQQRLHLGFHANPAGVKEAEAEARKIGALLDCGEFDWTPYLRGQKSVLTIADWVEKFERDYFTRRSRTAQSETTWEKDYLAVYKKLDQTSTLGVDLLRDAIIKTTPDTRTRKRVCLALESLAKFADLEMDTKALSGNYSPQKVKPRDLPEDRLIAEWFYKIPNDSWQWVYGVLATYGLRPHEVFHLNFEKMPILEILHGKTGSRQVWACFPEWVEEFDLKTPKVPNVNGKNNTDLGDRVGKAFKRYEVPFSPYDLRHCWAIRTLEFGLDISLAAAQMGHSVQVHSQHYHHWISERHHQRAYDLVMNRLDRPRAPTIFLTT